MTRLVAIAAVLTLATGAVGEGRWHGAISRARAAGERVEVRSLATGHSPDWARGDAEQACQRVVEGATREPDGIDAPMTRCVWHVACHAWLREAPGALERCRSLIGE